MAFILNSAPTYVIDKPKEILKIGAGYMELEFTIEDYDTTLAVAKEHINIIENGNEPSDIKNIVGSVTGGHFNRGVL